ncbi:Retrotransposon-derived protein PEG10 [Crotalus adamanteus]|uniref:Retrotransposon-derived protein PEG10 n=1 Tax=Crotalus adamanteus TaxID=8729 RepID=A0AAW1C0P1_CROAD
MFESQLEKLGYFLTQVWNYLKRYGGRHPDDSLRVNAISMNLEGDAMEWLVSLFDEVAPELHDVDPFMQELQNPFEDPTETRKADAKIRTIRQGKRTVAEYIREFCSLVAQVRWWPKHMLV